MKIGVVIASKDRLERCKQSIRSALRADADQIVIVDDGSENSLGYEELQKLDEKVKVVTSINQGPGPARMLGLKNSECDYIIILDDDDLLDSGAVSKVKSTICSNRLYEYPVLHFSTSNSWTFRKLFIANVSDIQNKLKRNGDFAPVVNKKFLDRVQYPRTKVGMEGILWLLMAHEFGVPTLSCSIINVGNGAQNRLTSWRTVVNRSEEYFSAQLLAIDLLKEKGLDGALKSYYRKKVFTAGMYYSLLKMKSKKRNFKKIWDVSKLLGLACFFAPRPLVLLAFSKYRERL